MNRALYVSNGGSVVTDASYALMGVNEDGEVVNDQKFRDFWDRVYKAMVKRDAEEEEFIKRTQAAHK